MFKKYTFNSNYFEDKARSIASNNKTSKLLFVLSFAESVVFPIPIDPLLAACVIAKPSRVVYITSFTIIASVLGGALGWYLGLTIEMGLNQFIVKIPGISLEDINIVKDGFSKWGLLLVFIGAFTPMPYKVIAILAGATGVPLTIFIIGSIIGRGIRFCIVATISYYFGSLALNFIRDKLTLSSSLIGILIIIVWVLIF